MQRLFGPVARQAMIYGCVRPLPCSVEALRTAAAPPTELAGWYNKSLLVSDRAQRCRRRIDPVGDGDGCSRIPSSVRSTRASG